MGLPASYLARTQAHLGAVGRGVRPPRGAEACDECVQRSFFTCPRRGRSGRHLKYQIPGSMSAHAHRLIFKFEIALLEAVLELPHCEALGKCGGRSQLSGSQSLS